MHHWYIIPFPGSKGIFSDIIRNQSLTYSLLIYRIHLPIAVDHDISCTFCWSHHNTWHCRDKIDGWWHQSIDIADNIWLKALSIDGHWRPQQIGTCTCRWHASYPCNIHHHHYRSSWSQGPYVKSRRCNRKKNNEEILRQARRNIEILKCFSGKTDTPHARPKPKHTKNLLASSTLFNGIIWSQLHAQACTQLHAIAYTRTQVRARCTEGSCVCARAFVVHSTTFMREHYFQATSNSCREESDRYQAFLFGQCATWASTSVTP